MTSARKLFEKVKRRPGGCQFNDLEALLRRVGATCDRQKGSHKVYVHPEVPYPIVIQNRGGEAVEYQVKQVVRAIEDYGLLGD